MGEGKAAVFLGGGVGDMILALGILERLEEEIGPFDTYCNHLEAFRFYTGKDAIPFATDPREAGLLEHYDYVLLLNLFAIPYKTSPIPRFKALTDRIVAFMEKYQLQASVWHHPAKDGDAARIALHHGFNRETLPLAMLGYVGTPMVTKRPDSSHFAPESDYITVHDGFGLNHLGQMTRATKSWDLSHWETFLSGIKKAHPEYKIVQIGGQTSRWLEGADLRFVHSFGIDESFKILAHSRLHIDTETGMVHAARSFGVRSVVLFGPTPLAFFAYPENINLASKACSPCYWMNDTWLAKCPLGYQAPICMNMILPDRVLQAVNHALEEKEGYQAGLAHKDPSQEFEGSSFHQSVSSQSPSLHG